MSRSDCAVFHNFHRDTDQPQGYAEKHNCKPHPYGFFRAPGMCRLFLGRAVEEQHTEYRRSSARPRQVSLHIRVGQASSPSPADVPHMRAESALISPSPHSAVELPLPAAARNKDSARASSRPIPPAPQPHKTFAARQDAVNIRGPCRSHELINGYSARLVRARSDHGARRAASLPGRLRARR